MRPRSLLPALAIPLLSAGLAAQSCVNPCISANWGEPLRNAQFLPTTFAIRVPGPPQNDVICQMELFCATRNSQPVQMPVWIYDRGPSGAPQAPIAAGTMLIGTVPGSCVASLSAPVQANTDFFIVFDNAVGNLRPPVSSWGNYGGTAHEHWHTGPNWSGPWFSGEYVYQLYCSSGTVQASFTTTGQGCAGTNGIPRIGAVGTPLIGTWFQVTLQQAPNLAPVVYAMGLVPNQVNLGLYGAPGCVVEHSPVISAALTAGSTGAASFPFQVPTHSSFVGMQIHSQWAVLDPGANQLGIVVSKGGVLTIGDF